MSANGQKTATVETLTAEVRVLMVGARQVTMSVAKQLDQIDPLEEPLSNFEPFGRCRSGVTTLRSRVVPRPRTRKESHWSDGRFWYEDYQGEPIYEFIGKRRYNGALALCVIGSLNDVGDDDKHLLKEWESLPLIVLAGLR